MMNTGILEAGQKKNSLKKHTLSKTFLMFVCTGLVLFACAGQPETVEQPQAAEVPDDTISTLAVPPLDVPADTPTVPPPDPSLSQPGLPPPEKEGPDEVFPRPDVKNRTELTVAITADSMELDFRKSYLASEAQLFTALYEGLFSYHPLTMEPVAAVAEKWELSEDKKTWTFHLRTNAKYWNGDPVRAADFRDAWISLLEPSRASPYSSLFDIISGARDYRLGALTDSARVGIEARDNNTLVVHLDAPASFFPYMLCHHSFAPIHPSMVKNEDWSTEPPLGNGPFYITENSGDRLVLAKNTGYWDTGRVSLQKIIYRLSDDPEVNTDMWNSGEARWVSGEVIYDQLTDYSGIVVNALFATHYYFIRSSHAPWNDYRVRQALIYALPWEEIRKEYSLPAETLIYPLQSYPAISGVKRTDLATAKRLLTEAGYPDGNGLPELVVRITPSEEPARVASIMYGAWQALGLKVRVDVVPSFRYFQMTKLDDYDVGFSTWIGDFADPYTFLQMWRKDSNLNDAKHNDDDYEELLDKSMGEEGQTRLRTMAKAEKLLLERGTVLPMFYSQAVNIIDTSELDGWFPNALDIHPFKYLAFKAFRPLPGVVLAQ